MTGVEYAVLALIFILIVLVAVLATDMRKSRAHNKQLMKICSDFNTAATAASETTEQLISFSKDILAKKEVSDKEWFKLADGFRDQSDRLFKSLKLAVTEKNDA